MLAICTTSYARRLTSGVESHLAAAVAIALRVEPLAERVSAVAGEINTRDGHLPVRRAVGPISLLKKASAPVVEDVAAKHAEAVRRTGERIDAVCAFATLPPGSDGLAIVGPVRRACAVTES